MPTAAPIVTDVYVEVISHTPDSEHVHIHYKGITTTGPLARSNICPTTQALLAARSPEKMRKLDAEYWSDAEAKAELADYLAANGMAVRIVPNPSVMQRRADEDARISGKTLSRKSPAT